LYRFRQPRCISPFAIYAPISPLLSPPPFLPSTPPPFPPLFFPYLLATDPAVAPFFTRLSHPPFSLFPFPTSFSCVCLPPSPPPPHAHSTPALHTRSFIVHFLDTSLVPFFFPPFSFPLFRFSFACCLPSFAFLGFYSFLSPLFLCRFCLSFPFSYSSRSYESHVDFFRLFLFFRAVFPDIGVLFSPLNLTRQRTSPHKYMVFVSIRARYRAGDMNVLWPARPRVSLPHQLLGSLFRMSFPLLSRGTTISNLPPLASAFPGFLSPFRLCRFFCWVYTPLEVIFFSAPPAFALFVDGALVEPSWGFPFSTTLQRGELSEGPGCFLVPPGTTHFLL